MKMKKIACSIVVALLAFVSGSAHADSCTTSLGVFFTPAQSISLCTKLGKFYSVDFNFIAGKTIGIQEATSASKCMGSVTFNGTTAVTVSTTCATTGSRIFLTPTSDPTGATAAYCWVTNIVTGVSFDVDCDQANDGTANWIVIHEAP